MIVTFITNRPPPPPPHPLLSLSVSRLALGAKNHKQRRNSCVQLIFDFLPCFGGLSATADSSDLMCGGWPFEGYVAIFTRGTPLTNNCRGGYRGGGGGGGGSGEGVKVRGGGRGGGIDFPSLYNLKMNKHEK